jgi:hypothetical protein
MPIKLKVLKKKGLRFRIPAFAKATARQARFMGKQKIEIQKPRFLKL